MKAAEAKRAAKEAGKRATSKPQARWKQRNREAFAPPQEVLPPYKPYVPHSGLFKPGHTGGRPPGCENKLPRILKELIMMAAEIEGADGEGTDGALGYLRMMAKEDRRTFAGLMRAIIPQQVERDESKANEVYQTVEEVRAELEERGITPEALRQMMLEYDDEADK